MDDVKRRVAWAGWRERIPLASRRLPTSVGRVHLLELRGAGSLPPMVLLHGFGASSLHYLSLATHLRRHTRQILAPDLPAHGFSDVPAVAQMGEGIRQGLTEALDDVVREPVVLFGNSMGGYAAIRYALARPERVKGLILCSPAGAPCTAESLEALKSLFRLQSHGDALTFVDRVLVRPGRLRHLLALNVRRRFGREALQSLLSEVAASELLDPADLARLEMPLMFVWGKRERILHAQDLGFFRQHLPAHAHVEEPESFGHCPFLEEPGALAALMVRFAGRL